MKRIILAAILAAIMPIVSNARTLVNLDLDSIQAMVKTDPEGFRSLTNRFLIGDSTLTLREKATVYYGQAYTDGFNPHASYPLIEEAYGNGDYSTTLLLADQALATNPASLDLTVRALTSATQVKGISASKALMFRARYDIICDAILSSGLGNTAQSPFRVISDNDEARVLRNLFQVKEILGRTTVNGTDAVKVTVDDVADPIILYFDKVTAKQ